MTATTIEQTFGAGKTGTALDQLCVDTIKTLAMDGVEQANSGHPGLPMGCADIATVLFTKVMKFDADSRDKAVAHAGQNVKIDGTVTGDTVKINSIEEAK